MRRRGALLALAIGALSTPLVLAPSWAPALAVAAPASATVDVDGDGDGETITGDEVLTIAGSFQATVRLPGKARLATLTAARLGSDKLIAVELDAGARPRRELWVGRLGAGEVAELARLPLGPQGADEEYAAAAEFSAKGLTRWQTRGDLARCDGAPLRLFAERWDPAARRWQPAPPSELPTSGGAAATVRAIGPVSGQPARAALFAVRPPSSQRGAGRADELGPAAELTDENPRTAWRPGVAGSDGRGEVLTFRSRLGKASKATRLRILPGDASSPAALRASSRPAKLWILGPRERFSATLPDPVASGGSGYLITLPQPIEECLSVVIESAHPGSGGDRSLAISELVIETDLEQQPDSAQALAELVRDGDLRAERMLAQLPQPQVARALLAALGKSSEVAQKRRLLRVLSQLSERDIGEPIAAALREGWIAEADLPDALSALSRIGDEAAMVELIVAPGTPPATKLEVARRLALRSSDKLVELAGLGAPELRGQIIDGLAQLPQARLLAAADQHPDSAAAMGDLWRAAVRRLFPTWRAQPPAPTSPSEAAERAALAAALSQKWPLAREYERRYRLATALAELAARAADLPLLSSVLAQLAAVPEPEAAALRQAVAAEVARLARPELAAALQGFLADRDAGVRLATVRGLSLRDAPAAAGDGDADTASRQAALATALDAALDASLATVLSADRWPELRRAAAAALARRCQRPAPAAALSRSVERDADVDVRQDALVALVTCASPGIAERLVRTWDSSRVPRPLRERAISLAVMLADRQLTPPLIRSLTRWRAEAFSDETSLRLAVLAASALGRLGGPDVAPALLAALEDGAYPELVAAAASGLGALGPACPPAARTKLLPLARSDERQISLAAKRALARCGSISPGRTAPEP